MKCPKCGKPNDDNWPVCVNDKIFEGGCQLCWEEECSATWWQIIEAADVKLQKIKDWCAAYPLDIFPEPDLEKAARVLKENGMTLDSISASNMRHVLTGIKNIIKNS